MQCKDGQKHESAVWIHQLVSKVLSKAASPRKPSDGIDETSCRFPKILDQIKICEEIQKRNNYAWQSPLPLYRCGMQHSG